MRITVTEESRKTRKIVSEALTKMARRILETVNRVSTAMIVAERANWDRKHFADFHNDVNHLVKGIIKESEKISQKIQTVQIYTYGAASAIEEIQTVIKQVNEVAMSISISIELQTETMNEAIENRAASGDRTNVGSLTARGNEEEKTASYRFTKMGEALMILSEKFQLLQTVMERWFKSKD